MRVQADWCIFQTTSTILNMWNRPTATDMDKSNMWSRPTTTDTDNAAYVSGD